MTEAMIKALAFLNANFDPWTFEGDEPVAVDLARLLESCASFHDTREAETLIRQEIRDKLHVVQAGANQPSRLQKEIVFKQCEDFLVELFRESSAPVPQVWQLQTVTRAGSYPHYLGRLHMIEKSPLVQEWDDAVGAATEWPVSVLLSRWVARVTAAGNALAKDYEIAVRRLREESEGRVRVHIALAQAIGGEAASKINDLPDPPSVSSVLPNEKQDDDLTRSAESRDLPSSVSTRPPTEKA